MSFRTVFYFCLVSYFHLSVIFFSISFVHPHVSSFHPFSPIMIFSLLFLQLLFSTLFFSPSSLTRWSSSCSIHPGCLLSPIRLGTSTFVSYPTVTLIFPSLSIRFGHSLILTFYFVHFPHVILCVFLFLPSSQLPFSFLRLHSFFLGQVPNPLAPPSLFNFHLSFLSPSRCCFFSFTSSVFLLHSQFTLLAHHPSCSSLSSPPAYHSSRPSPPVFFLQCLLPRSFPYFFLFSHLHLHPFSLLLPLSMARPFSMKRMMKMKGRTRTRRR